MATEQLPTASTRSGRSKWSKSWEKLTWTWRPESKREAGDAIVKNFLLHWFPAKVSLESLSWGYSFWLGTVSAILFVILAVTGAVLMFLYVPSTERAYQSVKDLEFSVSFGWFLRGLHRISAHLMVAVVFLHMVRVFLTGAFKNGRKTVGQNRPLNWIIGIVLLIITLLLSFTGYLLPWDQLAYWAITVGTNIASSAPVVGETTRFILLGGTTIEQATLIRFYVLHCFFLPLLMLLLVSYHMWRVRKDGGLACSDKRHDEGRKEELAPVKSKTYSLLGITGGTSVDVQNVMVDDEKGMVPSSPNLTVRLTVVTLVTMAVSILMTILVRAPLEEAANPAVTPNPAKAPWYFLWLQELVTITTFTIGGITINGALIGGIILPGVLVLAAILFPYYDKSPTRTVGQWLPKERKWQNIIFLAIVAFILVLTFVGTFMRGPFWELYMPWQEWEQMPRRF
ncbi:MAG: cytochrome bc complex cytochrome b subunit [Chloracidobacterium sp.]|nr:cytochrome bc complex cytochrome b subunit [Chloracidobacterium sp.]MCO5333439.1 cytochrome b N-terminal domain-containing protein [Pyrinomonadaceae bacterium]